MRGQGCSARLAAVGAGEPGTWGVGAVLRALPRLLRGWGALLLPGRPADPAQFRLINAVAAVILVVAAALPIAVLSLWRIPRARWVLLAVCWGVAVGCCTHALINIIQRVFSLAGLLRIEYSPTVWASIDRRAADLQDLFFNEPWFWVEGLGFGALGWIVLGSGRHRRWWVGTAITAISVLTVIGMLSATGVIGRTIIG